MSRSDRRRPGPRRSAGARVGRLAGGLATGVLTLSILLAAGVYLRLQQGPITLDRLRPLIEQRAAAALPGLRLEFGGAEIALGAGGKVRVQARDVTLYQAGEDALVRAPLIAGAFSFAQLVQGRFEPSEVILEGVTARVIRSETGAFSFGFGGEETEVTGEGARLFAQLLAASTTETAQDADQATPSQRLLLSGASLFYLDLQSRRLWRSQGVDIVFHRTTLGVQGRTRVTLAGGRYGDMTLSLSGYRATEGDLFLSARFDNAAPRDIADQIEALDWLAAFDAPVDGDIRLGVTREGELLQLGGRLDAGAGRIALGGEVTEELTAAALAFEFEPDTERFIISRAALDSPRAGFEARGFVEVGRDAEGAPVDAVAQIDLSRIIVSAPEMFHAPLVYEEARATGRVTFSPLLVEIGEMRLVNGPLFVDAAGRLELDGDSVRADIALNGGGMTVGDLLDHWPLIAAPGAYDWMMENMEEADVTDFDASLRLDEAGSNVKFDFSFENASGHYLRPMPPITDAVGAGQLDLKRFTLAVDSGVVTPEGGEPLQIGGSTFVITDLDHPDTPADIDLRVTGRLADALTIADHEPLGFISRLELPLDDVTGQARILTKTTIPLLKDLLLDDVTAAAEATFTEFGVTAPGVGGRITADVVSLEADTEKFRLRGRAAYQGLVADIDWRETYEGSRRRVTLASEVTPAMLAEFGLETPWFRGGAAAFAGDISFPKGTPTLKARVDLAAADLAVSEIGWVKPPGEAAEVAATIKFAAGAIRVPAYSLASRDLNVEGDVLLAGDGAPQRIALRRLSYRGGAEASAVGRLKDGRWNIDIEGSLLDLTKFPDLIEGGDVGRGTPLRLKLAIDRVQLRPQLHLRAAEGVFRVGEDGGVSGRLQGVVDGSAPFELKVDTGPDGGEATITSANAGRFLRAAGAFEDGSGGELKVTARIADAEALEVEGVARLTDIIIHEDAKLEQLLAGADLAELEAQMEDEGIAFSRVTLPFTYRGGVLSARNAVAVGPSIGVNISGDYMLEEDRLDLDGVFTPLYALNAALGGIPLLGDLLTGGDGQGLFAFTFTAKGPAENPSISVNPLSVLTPGIFRKVFSLDGDPEAAEAVRRLRDQERR